MISISTAILIVVLSLAIGFIAGFGYCALYWDGFDEKPHGGDGQPMPVATTRTCL